MHEVVSPLIGIEPQWDAKVKNLLLSKQKVIEKCRQHLADYPADRWKVEASYTEALSVFEKTISSVDQTLLRIEQSIALLSSR